MKIALLLLTFFSPFVLLGQQNETVAFPPESEDEVFMVVEKMPQFPGGVDSMQAFIGKNIVYKKEALDSNIQGKVYVSFILNKMGELHNINIIKGLGYGLDEECIRVVKAMPKWTPGELRGKKVNVKITIPIKFALSK